MNRIVVYGLASVEKEELVKTLNQSMPDDYTLLSSTPDNRFTEISTNKEASVYSAPWQILVANLADERLQTLPNIEKNYPQCDFKRPLVVIFNGGDSVRVWFESYKLSLDKEKYVQSLFVNALSDVTAKSIINAFQQIEYRDRLPYQASTFSL